MTPEEQLMEERKARGVNPMAQQEITQQQNQPMQLPTPAQGIQQVQTPQPMTTEQLIAKQQQDLQKMKASNDALEAEVLRSERLKAQAYQAGKGFIHAPPAPPETPEEKWRRERKAFYKGTGLDPT